MRSDPNELCYSDRVLCVWGALPANNKQISVSHDQTFSDHAGNHKYLGSEKEIMFYLLILIETVVLSSVTDIKIPFIRVDIEHHKRMNLDGHPFLKLFQALNRVDCN